MSNRLYDSIKVCRRCWYSDCPRGSRNNHSPSYQTAEVKATKSLLINNAIKSPKERIDNCSIKPQQRKQKSQDLSIHYPILELVIKQHIQTIYKSFTSLPQFFHSPVLSQPQNYTLQTNILENKVVTNQSTNKLKTMDIYILSTLIALGVFAFAGVCFAFWRWANN